MPLNKDEIENIMIEIEQESELAENSLEERWVVDTKTVRRILQNPCLPGSIQTREIKNDDK